jgi:hypothetical protein
MSARKYTSRDVLAGLFLAFSAGLFVAMLVLYSRVGQGSGERLELVVYFENVSGLRPNAPVRYNGYEAGRVRYLRTVRVTEKTIEALGRPFQRGDVDNLPLRSDEDRKALLAASDDAFDALARKAVLNQTLVQVGLDVQSSGDERRFRVDDQVRIASTVFGDASVEIASGQGPLNAPPNLRALLGNSGDFFSNLARSMNDVREILNSVTNVVGTQERRSFEHASSRLGSITEKLEAMAATSNRRAEVTSKRMDLLGREVRETMERMDGVATNARTRAKETGKLMKDGMKEMRAKSDDVRETASDAWTSSEKEITAIRNDVLTTQKAIDPDLQATRDSVRAAYEQADALSAKFDGMSAEAAALAVRSEPELPRISSALLNSLTNLRNTGEAAIMNKDLMISRRDKGEYEYHTALDIYRKLTFSSRSLREASAETRQMERALTEELAGRDAIDHAHAALKGIDAVRLPLEQARVEIEATMVPPFVRKKAGWPAAKE